MALLYSSDADKLFANSSVDSSPTPRSRCTTTTTMKSNRNTAASFHVEVSDSDGAARHEHENNNTMIARVASVEAKVSLLDEKLDAVIALLSESRKKYQ